MHSTTVKNRRQTTVLVPRLYGQETTDTDMPVEVIFIKGELFKQLFWRFDKTGKGVKPDIEQFQYCAHVRSVNTEGTTGASGAEKGLFSVVHSKRSGPTDIAAQAPPRPQVVHVVSLEGLEAIDDVPDNALVALVSLYSWTYLCQPPLTVNFVDSKFSPLIRCWEGRADELGIEAMRDIGIQIKYSQLTEEEKDKIDELLPVGLGPGALGNADSWEEAGIPQTILEKILEDERPDIDGNIRDTPTNCGLRCTRRAVKSLLSPGTTRNSDQSEAEPDPSADIKRAMVTRLENGYTLVRYRVHSGEETCGLFRGPLLPVYPREAPDFWPFASNNGQDFQMFDTTLSVMDISYSSAWHIGKVRIA